MRHWTFWIGAILAVFALMSCDDDFLTTTLEVDPPPFEEQLVLNSLIHTSDSLIAANVSRNYPILMDVEDLSTLDVQGAQVEIWHNDNILVTLFENLGPSRLYANTVAPSLFTSGETYTMRVSHPDFPTLSATQTVPTDVELERITFEEDGGVDEDGDEASAIEIVLNDPPGEANYYQVFILRRVQQMDGSMYYNLLHSSSFHPSTSRGVEYEGLLITDQTFDGNRVSMEILIRPWRVENADELFVMWKNMTEAAYRYSRTLRQQEDTEDNPFSTPTQLYTNVEGGLGIFTLTSINHYPVVN